MEVKVEKEKMMTPKLELVEGAQHESPEISSTQGTSILHLHSEHLTNTGSVQHL